MSEDQVFDLNKFRSKRTGAQPKKPAKPKRPKADETFARVPYQLVMQAYGKLSAAALFVLIELDHQHFSTFGQNPVRLTNQTGLGTAGMPPSTKARALRKLREAGLVRFTQAGKGAFMVTLLWHPIR